MFRHSMTVALLGLSLSGSFVWADSQDQRREDRQDQRREDRHDQRRDDRQDQRQDGQDQQTHRQLRSYLGVGVSLAPQGSGAQQEGVMVLTVNPNSPAGRAGLQQGDVITQVGRRTVEDFRDLANAINRLQPGEQVNIQVQRNGQQRRMQVRLAAAQAGQAQEAEQQDRSQQTNRQQNRDGQERHQQGYAQQGRDQQDRDQQGHDRQARQSRDGDDSSDHDQALRRLQQRFEELENRFQEITQQSRSQRRYGRLQEDSASQSRSLHRLQQRVEELEERLQQAQQQDQSEGHRGDQLGIQTERRASSSGQGLRVTEVEDDSVADEAGLRRGDVILRVDGRRVSSSQDVRQALQQAEPGQEVTVEVLRNGRHRELDLRAPRSSRSQARGYERLQQRLDRLERQIRERDED